MKAESQWKGPPVEAANPEQYLRLLLMRLLETQKALKPVIYLPQLGVVRQQFSENEYILSEVRKWLERQPKEIASPLGPLASTAMNVALSGPESFQASSGEKPTLNGSSSNPFVWATYKSVEPAGTSQVLSSLPSGSTLPGSAEISNGQIVFQPPSLNGKLDFTSSGLWDSEEE